MSAAATGRDGFSGVFAGPPQARRQKRAGAPSGPNLHQPGGRICLYQGAITKEPLREAVPRADVIGVSRCRAGRIYARDFEPDPALQGQFQPLIDGGDPAAVAAFVRAKPVRRLPNAGVGKRKHGGSKKNGKASARAGGRAQRRTGGITAELQSGRIASPPLLSRSRKCTRTHLPSLSPVRTFYRSPAGTETKSLSFLFYTSPPWPAAARRLLRLVKGQRHPRLEPWAAGRFVGPAPQAQT